MNSKYFVLLTCLLVSHVWAKDPSQKQYSDVKQFMHELARTHPSTVQSVIIGPSDSGELIEGLSIGDGPLHNLVVATHHGNEYGSTEVSLSLAASLANNPIPNQTVYVIPVLNIKGYNAKNREEKDALGISRDPNRDYPGPCGTEGPHFLKSTASLAQFINRENIINSATLHTFYPAVVYPWGISTYDVSTLYDDLFKIMANKATEMSHYTVGNSTQVIYPADGCYEDYAFWKHGIWSILFELGFSHHPSQGEIDEMVRTNVPGIRKMLAEAQMERAVNHDFAGQCIGRLRHLDRHDE